MLIHYLTLGIETTADDAAIRQKYLELVKAYPPETEPVQFRRISTAYDAIKDERRRIASLLFESIQERDPEAALVRLATVDGNKRKRIGLTALIGIQERISG